MAMAAPGGGAANPWAWRPWAASALDRQAQWPLALHGFLSPSD